MNFRGYLCFPDFRASLGCRDFPVTDVAFSVSSAHDHIAVQLPDVVTGQLVNTAPVQLTYRIPAHIMDKSAADESNSVSSRIADVIGH
jgi:hypothetical protein